MIDIEDMDTGINIMDLGLNEFRLDLLSYIKEHPDIEHAPFGMNAVAGVKGDVKPGVIYVLKNRNNAVNIDKKNLLHPFYMVYLSDDGEVICASKNTSSISAIFSNSSSSVMDPSS